jgi:hypothetical protein
VLEAADGGGWHLYGLQDDEWDCLTNAPAVVLDFSLSREAEEGDDEVETALRAACEALRAAGLREALWTRHASGYAAVAAVGDAAALIGPHPGDCHALLPLHVRSGGGGYGWGRLYACLASSNDAAAVAAGIHRGCAVQVYPACWTGAHDSVDLLVSPPREHLAAGACEPSLRDYGETAWDNCGFAETGTAAAMVRMGLRALTCIGS